jgi:hypothetical protein
MRIMVGSKPWANNSQDPILKKPNPPPKKKLEKRKKTLVQIHVSQTEN